jgi:hypothetical protein
MAELIEWIRAWLLFFSTSLSGALQDLLDRLTQDSSFRRGFVEAIILGTSIALISRTVWSWYTRLHSFLNPLFPLDSTHTVNFPSYRGSPLPMKLSPIVPAHYLHFFKWIYFQPSKLRHYYHQANSDLLRNTDENLIAKLQVPAFRNVYIIRVIAISLSLVLSYFLLQLVLNMDGRTATWAGLFLGLLVGISRGSLSLTQSKNRINSVDRRPSFIRYSSSLFSAFKFGLVLVVIIILLVAMVVNNLGQ